LIANLRRTKYYTEEDIVISPLYTYATPFSQGFAVVSESDHGDFGELYFITPEGAWAFTKKNFFRKCPKYRLSKGQALFRRSGRRQSR
jgi:hypothetical protein